MITAEYVRDDRDDVEAVIFEDAAGSTFTIMRALSFDAQDRADATDTYCLVAHTGATYYGGVVEWSRDADDLAVLVLTPEAADELEVPREFDLAIEPARLDAIDPVVLRLTAGPSTDE